MYPLSDTKVSYDGAHQGNEMDVAMLISAITQMTGWRGCESVLALAFALNWPGVEINETHVIIDGWMEVERLQCGPVNGRHGIASGMGVRRWVSWLAGLLDAERDELRRVMSPEVATYAGGAAERIYAAAMLEGAR